MPHATTRHPVHPERNRTRQDLAAKGTEPPRAMEFPGCDPVSLPTWDDVWAYDGRIEYWLRETGTAWVLRDAGPVHETAPSLLSELLTRLGQERGSRVRCAGAVYLMERDEDGRPRQVLVADQTIYLDRSVWRPRDPAIVLGVGPPAGRDPRGGPHHRRPAQQAAGVRGVGVPRGMGGHPRPEPSRNRPRRVRPGLTIYVLEEGRFRTADESRAFPTWTALQIHAALNESRLGSRTLADLTRVGRRLGEREGTTPDDDLQIRRHRRRAHADGRASGLAEGFARERARLARQASRKFGPRTAERLAGLIAGVGDQEHLASVGDLIIDCDDGDDLLLRLRSA